MSLFSRLRDRKAARNRQDTAVMLYNQAVNQGRQPGFYYDWAVPDTFDGRFDMIVLHVVLMFRRLKGQDGQLAQVLYDVMTTDLEQNLRSQGVGDEGILHRSRKYTEGVFARLTGYTEALDADDSAALASALRTSLYRPIVEDDVAQPVSQVIAAYMMAQAQALSTQDLSEDLAHFGPCPIKEEQ